MFERLNTPQEAYNYKLGAALKMEQTVLEGLEKEGRANARKTDDALVDGVLLQAAAEVEHHEIGVYENLIIHARAMGRSDVAQLLEQNLEQEQHTLREVLHEEERFAGSALL